MKLYAIREVSEITGIKPVTLRAWQRRYGLIQPQRKESGHRLYTEENIEKIKLIQRWLAKGIAIGKVKALIESGEDIGSSPDSAVLTESEDLLIALSALNRGRAESVVSTVLKEYPLNIVMEQFFYPVLESLERVKASQRSLQKALLQSLMISKATSILEAENRAFKKLKALVINLDETGSLPAWMSAIELSDRGYSISFLDGVDDISGLTEMTDISRYDLIYLFSNSGLPAKTEQSILALRAKTEVDIETSALVNA
ncbi:MerR family transcriptional regulator [Vibrio sp. JC009]|uniref:MerR family transcriptional regulator n=1 Tax=Vibrio sp. JC009 TaxID=2912314 RepID=UPI0023B084C2|nr:MerR family transcriptional regulator [Vibrio sp. JC009]WED23587.1 MerR family transcriptional regulator [Vibrio sp. JC009]